MTIGDCSTCNNTRHVVDSNGMYKPCECLVRYKYTLWLGRFVAFDRLDEDRLQEYSSGVYYFMCSTYEYFFSCVKTHLLTKHYSEYSWVDLSLCDLIDIYVGKHDSIEALNDVVANDLVIISAFEQASNKEYGSVLSDIIRRRVWQGDKRPLWLYSNMSLASFDSFLLSKGSSLSSVKSYIQEVRLVDPSSKVRASVPSSAAVSKLVSTNSSKSDNKRSYYQGKKKGGGGLTGKKPY